MPIIKLPIDQPKTWILDVDGVVFIHNSHLDGDDVLVDGIRNFIDSIPKDDYVLLLTARDYKYKDQTLMSLKKHGIRYDEILFGMPKGERILINDAKPDGQATAYALNPKRDSAIDVTFER